MSAYTTMFTYDETTGIVHVTLLKRISRRRREAVTALPVARERLRQLCDQLHDYADLLDRLDNSATAQPEDATKLWPGTLAGAPRPADATNRPLRPHAPAQLHTTAHEPTTHRSDADLQVGAFGSPELASHNRAPAVINPNPGVFTREERHG